MEFRFICIDEAYKIVHIVCFFSFHINIKESQKGLTLFWWKKKYSRFDWNKLLKECHEQFSYVQLKPVQSIVLLHIDGMVTLNILTRKRNTQAFTINTTCIRYFTMVFLCCLIRKSEYLISLLILFFFSPSTIVCCLELAELYATSHNAQCSMYHMLIALSSSLHSR